MGKEQEAVSTVIKEGCPYRGRILSLRLASAFSSIIWHHGTHYTRVSAAAVADVQNPSPIKIQISLCSNFPQTGPILDSPCQEIPQEKYTEVIAVLNIRW